LPGKRLALAGVAVTIAAVTALTVLPGLLRPRGGPATATIPGSVAVVGFENQTGDPKYDYLRKVIPNLLITNLESTGLFQVATWERMRDLLGQMGRSEIEVLDADAGFDYCQREGIAFVVVGSYTRAGETFVTESKLLDAQTRRMVKSAVARGAGEASILDIQIDDISRKIATRRLINPLYQLRVAGIYEKKGDKAKAVEHYQTFVRFWRDSDPGLPELPEARKRLAALGR